MWHSPNNDAFQKDLEALLDKHQIPAAIVFYRNGLLLKSLSISNSDPVEVASIKALHAELVAKVDECRERMHNVVDRALLDKAQNKLKGF
jgi:hypothetical protein